MTANQPEHHSSTIRTSFCHFASCTLSKSSAPPQRCSKDGINPLEWRAKKMRSLRRLPRSRILPVESRWSRVLWAVRTRALRPPAAVSTSQIGDAGPHHAPDPKEQHGAETLDRVGREASARHSRRPCEAQEKEDPRGNGTGASSKSTSTTSHSSIRPPSASSHAISAAVSATVSAAWSG